MVEKEEIKKTDFSNFISTQPNNINFNNNNNNNFKDFTILNTDNINSNIANNHRNIKAEVSEGSMDSSTIYKIKEKLNSHQYTDIISERENSKKLINDFIKDSISFNYNNHNNNDISNNTNISTNPNVINKNINNNNNNKNCDFFEDKKINFGKDEENKSTNNNNNNQEIINNYFNNQQQQKSANKSENQNTEAFDFYEKQRFSDLSYNNINVNNQENSKNKNPFENYQNQNKQIFNNALNNFEIKENKSFDKIQNEILEKNKTMGNNEKEKEQDQSPQEEIRSNKAKSVVQESNSNNNQNNNKPSKADKILEIVIKIRTIEDVSSIVYHLFGEDILDKLISPNVDEELIEKVDATIQEIEKLMLKGKKFCFICF